MIGMLRGRVAFRAEGQLVVDVNGVGYEVSTPDRVEGASTAARAASGPAEEVTLFVHTHVKEDALTLFGFSTLDERDVFRLLLGVSNVGPRTALALLSGLSVTELAEAVARKDLLRLSKVQGIGKKTAERLTFELQDKLPAFVSVRGMSPSRPSLGAPKSAGPRADLLSALTNLGYKQPVAERAAAAVESLIDEGVPFEALLREALKALAKP